MIIAAPSNLVRLVLQNFSGQFDARSWECRKYERLLPLVPCSGGVVHGDGVEFKVGSMQLPTMQCLCECVLSPVFVITTTALLPCSMAP